MIIRVFKTSHLALSQGRWSNLPCCSQLLSPIVHLCRARSSVLEETSGSLQPLVGYEQGQEPDKGIRQYFYYIDHNGQLFLDDARMKNFTSCFKDKDFLVFFYKRLRLNNTGYYEDHFPYLSLCGREQNFIRCDDRPIVYTNLIQPEKDGAAELSYNHTSNQLTVPLNVSELTMLPASGRVYYPSPKTQYGKVALVSSKLALKFAKHFQFGNGEDSPPTHILWRGARIELKNELFL